MYILNFFEIIWNIHSLKTWVFYVCILYLFLTFEGEKFFFSEKVSCSLLSLILRESFCYSWSCVILYKYLSVIMNFIYVYFSCSIYVLMYFVECFKKHETFCQFVTKRGSLLGEMSLLSRLRILFPKLPKGEFVSFNYWLNIRKAKWIQSLLIVQTTRSF